MIFEAPSWIGVAAICASILVAIFSKWWDPIAAHVGYPFGVDRRLEELGRKVQWLSDKQIDLRRGDPLPSAAERIGWLKGVDDLQKAEKLIKDEIVDCGISYFKRCYIGNKIDTELNKTNDLISQGDKLLPEVKARPHPVRHVQPQELRGPLPGMEVCYDKVLRFIKDKSGQSPLLGVWGMGGIGKTTLINLVHDSRSTYYGYFDEVLFVQAGKGFTTVADLQKAIAISIALPQIGNRTSQANIIHNHLKDKRFLLLIDDLWEDLDLDEVGIPSLDVVQPHMRKVIFTTSSMYVCSKMGCCRHSEDTVQMKCLNKQDAWNLFAQKVGNKIFDGEEIHELAKEIAAECGGLPMALCNIGKIVSALKDPREWRTTKDLLKKSKLHQLTGRNEDLFRRLQESYDTLTDDMKERFLLCSLWPENDNISMKKLITWWTGLGLLDVSNASDMGYTHINSLVHASMLEKGDTGLDSAESSHVKVHNMTRMMAIWIVNEHGYKNKWLPNSSFRLALAEEKWSTVEKAWVSQEDTSRWCHWSYEVSFPQLKMLVAQHAFSYKLIICYFQKITFLDLEGTETDRFPFEICELTELQHLNLSATTFDVLPLELKKLSKLKFLHIRNNIGLQTIPEGLLLDLKRLQGLDLFHTGVSFSKVQYTSSLLEELTSPTIDLHMLGFSVQTIADVSELAQLTRVCTHALCMYHFEDESDLDIINLEFLSELKELRELTIEASSHRKKVLIAEGGPKYDQWLLPYLEIFELGKLPKLEKVSWRNAGMNIRVVSVYKCDQLKNVTWVCYLRHLEELTVTHCSEMQMLIETGESPLGVRNNQTTTVRFPRMKKLKLEELPKLSMICTEACEFDELSYICVTRCNEMKYIQYQKYKQSMIKIDCSEDWWNKNSSGRFIPFIAPTFYS